MSETTTEPAAPAEPETPPEGDKVDRLEAKVDKLAEMIAGLFKGGSKPDSDAEGEAASVAAEVKRELARLKAAEERKAKADGESAKVAELEEKVKKIAEKPPREYRRITSILWGSDE